MRSNARFSFIIGVISTFLGHSLVYAQSAQFAVEPVVLEFAETPPGSYLSVQGVTVDWVVALERTSSRGDGFALFVESGNSVLSRVDVAAPKTWRGTILNDAGGELRLSIVDGRIRGIVTTLGEQYYLGSAVEFDADASPAATVLVRFEDLPQPPAAFCGVQGAPTLPSFALGPQPSGALRIAVDIDFDQYLALNSEVGQVVDFVDEVFNLASPAYAELDLAPQLVAVVVRTTPGPYVSGVPSALLAELEAQWENNIGLSAIPRTLTHLFSGKDPVAEPPTFPAPLLGLANGIGTLCDEAYSWTKVDDNIVTTAKVFAHGIGHSSGASHCSLPCSDACGPVTSDCAIMCTAINACSLEFVFSTEAGGPADQINDFAQTLPVGCLGDPIASTSLPFEERFDSGSLDASKWSYQNGVSLEIVTGLVSAPNAMVLSGTGSPIAFPSRIVSACIDASGLASGPILTFFSRNQSVPAGDLLEVEWLDANGIWQPIALVPESNPALNFQFHAFTLGPFANHSELRLRVTYNGSTAAARWYIDDLRLTDGLPSNLSGIGTPVIDSVTPNFIPTGYIGDLIIEGENFIVDNGVAGLVFDVILGPLDLPPGPIVEDRQTIRVPLTGGLPAGVLDVTVLQFGQLGTLVGGLTVHESEIGAPDLAIEGESEVVAPIMANLDRSIRAFGFGVQYDPTQLAVMNVTEVGTSIEFPTPDFVMANLEPRGEWSFGYVRDFVDDTLGVDPGDNLVLALATYTVLPAGQNTTVTFDIGEYANPPAPIQFESGAGDFLLMGSATFPVLAASHDRWIRGDANDDGVVTGLGDGLFFLNYLFAGGAVPPCLAAIDVNDDNILGGLVDALALLTWQFAGGSPPPAPFPACGIDFTPEGTCVSGGAQCP